MVLPRVDVIVQLFHKELHLFNLAALLQGQNNDTVAVQEPDDLAPNMQGHQFLVFFRHALAQLGLFVLDETQDFFEQRHAMMVLFLL